jgi:hypothetical protein
MNLFPIMPLEQFPVGREGGAGLDAVFPRELRRSAGSSEPQEQERLLQEVARFDHG